MQGDRGAPPRYAQIAAAIRAQIIAGRLGGPGARVPSEPEITDTYGVSKTTASHALQMLAAEGLIIRKVGTGSYIADGLPAMITVHAPAGSQITARAAEPGDWADDEPIPAGVMALVVQKRGRPAEIYPADRTIIVTG